MVNIQIYYSNNILFLDLWIILKSMYLDVFDKMRQIQKDLFKRDKIKKK